jgi:stage V sporulation protein SpoVS
LAPVFLDLTGLAVLLARGFVVVVGLCLVFVPCFYVLLLELYGPCRIAQCRLVLQQVIPVPTGFLLRK